MILAPLLLAPLLLGPRAAPAEPGLVILVAREEIADASLRRGIDELVGDGPRLELHMGRAVCEDQPGHRDLYPEDLAGPGDEELAREVRAAEVLVLRGGRFMEWYETLLPPKEETRLARALREAWRGGAHVVAHGDAASFVAGASVIPRAELDRPARNPRRTALETAVVGLGFGPPGIVDGRGWHVGDPLVLLRQLWETKVDLGLFLEGEVALVTRRTPHRTWVLGTGHVVLVDLDGARRQKRAIRAGRLALLGEGDAFEYGHWRVVPGPGEPGGPEDAEAPPSQPASLFDHEPEPLDLGVPIRRLASSEHRPPVIHIGPRELSLREDGATRWWLGPRRRLRGSGVVFDLTWDE